MPVPTTATFNRVGDDMRGPTLAERLGSGAAADLETISPGPSDHRTQIQRGRHCF